MKDFTVIKNMHSHLVVQENNINPISEDYSFFKELKASIESLLHSITTNPQKPLPFSLLNKVSHGCVRFENDNLDEYVTFTIKPIIENKIQIRRREMNLIITHIFNAIYTPGNPVSESEALIYDSVAKLKCNFETIEDPLPPSEMKVKMFHRICDHFLNQDLTDKHGIFMPLVRLVKKQFPTDGPVSLDHESVRQRKTLLQPYQPTRFPAGDYTHVVAPLLHRFKRLTVKPGCSSENDQPVTQASTHEKKRTRKF